MSSDRMRLEDTTYLRDKYSGEDLGGHYLGCWKDHIGCAIEKLLDEVDALRAEAPSKKTREELDLPPADQSDWYPYHD